MGRKITEVCDYCKKSFERDVGQSRGEHTYCSRDCADKVRRTRFIIECRWCNKPFEITPTQFGRGYRLCSWKCRLAEKDDARNRICEICGKPFRVRDAAMQNRTCSRKCGSELRKRGKYRKCEICGKQFWVMPSSFETARFCSRKCKDIGHGKDISGSNHPHWNGGTGKEPYPFEWTNELKELIRNRDGNKCMECGDVENLTVHHIDYDKSNCVHSNLITLCNPCNARANFSRSHWQARYSDMIESIYCNST